MVRVLQALADHPTRWRYGYDLGNEVGLKPGSFYPFLVRLADCGLLEASWESPVQRKPPRRLYRLTTARTGRVRCYPGGQRGAAGGTSTASAAGGVMGLI